MIDPGADLSRNPNQPKLHVGIGTKITLLLCAVAVLASSAVGFTTYWQFDQALVNQELKNLSSLARAKAVRFTAEMEALRSDALLMSHTSLVQRFIHESHDRGVEPDGETEQEQLERIAGLFEELLRAKPTYCRARLIGIADGGREIVRVNCDLNSHLLTRVPSNELQKQGRESYFSGALGVADGDVFLSDVELNREYGQVSTPLTPVIRAATPVFGRDGKPVAILIINCFFQPIVDGLRKGISENQTLLVANDRGDYLVHPDAERTFGSDRGKSARIQDDYRALSEVFDAVELPVASIVDESQPGDRIAIGVDRAQFDPSHPNRFLTIAVATSYDEAIADSVRSRKRSLAACAAVVLVAFVSGYFISRSVTEPLREIASAAQAFGRGERNVALPTSSRDEIGVMARSLAGMMDEVQTAHANLESRAEELSESRRSALNMLQDMDSNRAKSLEAERIAREQSARTQAIFDGATDAIITIRSDGAIESFNGAAERMFGYAASDVLGKNVNMLMPEPYHGEHDQYLHNYLETGISKIIGSGREVVGLRSDGRTFPMDLAVSEVRLGEQRLFTGIVRDISKLKQTMSQLSDAHDSLKVRAEELEASRRVSVRAEQEAHDQAARTQAILDGASDAIITINVDGVVESFNMAAERIFGYSADEVIGKNVNGLMPSPYHEEHDGYLHNYLTTGISKIIGIGREVLGLRADGTTFPMHLAISDVKLGDRRLFTGIVRDITDLKQAMQQLTAANVELARRAEQIGQFNLDLSRSNEELKQFAYVASHDLQEPLRKVTAFCQMLRDDYGDRLDENAQTYIQYAVDGALRMKTLVQDLLTYSRVETQGKPLEPTDADDACAEAIENLTIAIDEAAAEITRGQLPMVNADRAQLVRLFQNLIGNAIKYRGDKPPQIHVAVTEQGDKCEFRIRDNGIGIDPQYFERIFVIFQRLHGRDEYSGTGIGLAVCKRIVERAGGRIWVESSEGAGSEFCFTLAKVLHIPPQGAPGRDRHTQPATSAVH